MRYFITIGSPECPGLGLAKLERVGSDVAAVVDLLGSASQGYTRALATELPLGARSDVIKRELGEWFLSDVRTENDCVVIYVAGHGDMHGTFGAHCLLTSDTREGAVYTAVKTEELVDLIFAGVRYPRNVLVILDVCFAGRGAGDVIASVGRSLKTGFPTGAGLYVIATADRNSEADDGAFVRAWQMLMADENGAWLPRGGKEFLSVDDFKSAVNEYLGPASAQRVIMFSVTGPDHAKFIKNPRYQEGLDGLAVDLLTHWRPKAFGDETTGGARSFFTGREAVLAACRAWLQAESTDGHARVVTGAPGSGKSAVLGQIVLNPGEHAPRLARVHARGQQSEEVVTAIARQLGCKAARADQLIAELATIADTVGIVVDSLDEAANSSHLERDVLRGIATCPQVRLIVGVRRRPGTAPFVGAHVVLDLDGPEYFNPADVNAYSFALLTARDGIQSAYANDAAAREVAQIVAQRAGKSFLYARLASRCLAEAAPVDITAPNWKAELKLPDQIEALFGADLDRFDHPTRQRFVDLLVPLAYARRRGLPQKHVWFAVASRIAGVPYTNADIRDLKERAGFYLIQDTEDGETVFRLFHQSFADYLKRETRDQDVETQFASALADLVAEAGGWAKVKEPYLLSAYPSHAAAAGRLGEALADAEFLVTMAPKALLPELHKVSDPRGWPLAQAYRQASHWFAAGKRQEGSKYLLLAALKYNSAHLAQRLGSLYEADSLWWPKWARWTGAIAGWVGVEADNPISALCVGQDSDGNALAVCGHNDGSVSIWHLNNGTKLLDYRPSAEAGAVTFITVADVPGDKLIVGAWKSGLMQVFRQLSGETTGFWQCENRHWLSNIVIIDDGASKLAAVGAATELLLFELPNLDIRVRRPNATNATIYSLATTKRENIAVVISGCDTKSKGRLTEPHPIKLWDARNLEPLLEAGESLNIARHLLSFDVEDEPFLLVTEWNSVEVLRVGDLKTAGPTCHTYDDLVAAYSAEGQTVVLWTNSHGSLRASSVHKVRNNGADTLIVMDPDLQGAGADARGKRWSSIVSTGGRPILLGAEDKLVRVWDIDEFVKPAGAISTTGPTFKDVVSLVGWGETLFLGSRGGQISAWDHLGNQLWTNKLTKGEIRHLAIASGGSELLVDGGDGRIYRIATATGTEQRPTLDAGSAVRALVVRPTTDDERVFAATEASGLSGRSLYFVRAWDLSTGSECRTWKSAVGPEAMQGDQQLSDDESFNGFEPELALGGYYRSKTLYGMTAFEFQGWKVVALAGPHGKVRVMDAGTLSELACWIGGASNEYIYHLAGGVVDGEPYVYGGDEQGTLFRGGITCEAIDLKRRTHAHRGSIDQLLLRETPRGWVLASGGSDGSVRFWAPDLRPLFEIDVGRAVIALSWMVDDLIIATDRGVMSISIMWPKVL